MAWRIDRDYLAEKNEPSHVGRGQWGKEFDNGPEPKAADLPYRFRLRDDDGEVYYGGAYDAAALNDDEGWGGLYLALKWGEWDSGATDLQVKGADYLALSGPNEYVEKATDREGWYSVFG